MSVSTTPNKLPATERANKRNDQIYLFNNGVVIAKTKSGHKPEHEFGDA